MLGCEQCYTSRINLLSQQYAKLLFYMVDIKYKQVSVCACIFQTKNWRFRGRAAAFGGAEQHSGDETGETQPTGRHQNFPLTFFCDVFNCLAQRNQFNIPKGRSLACMTPRIDSHKRYPYLTVFQTQLDPGVIQAVSNERVVEPVVDLKSSFIGRRD